MKNDKLIFFQADNLPSYVVGVNCTRGYTVTVSSLSTGSSIEHRCLSTYKLDSESLAEASEKKVQWYRENGYIECSETWFQTKRLNALGVVSTDVYDAILTQVAL